MKKGEISKLTKAALEEKRSEVIRIINLPLVPGNILFLKVSCPDLRLPLSFGDKLHVWTTMEKTF
ncbi:hypothetical protein KAV79_06130 [Candidatus Aerophobetes bacterium]|nr:hypothetical protein [Candidatus Aerophobetes bacterium]